MKANKPSTFNNIPAKILNENVDICGPFISRFNNISLTESSFPNSLKKADIIPVHKKEDKFNVSNYRPNSILPSISKVFEKMLYDQIIMFAEKFFSNKLCGFRKCYSSQIIILDLVNNWQECLDNKGSH